MVVADNKDDLFVCRSLSSDDCSSHDLCSECAACSAIAVYLLHRQFLADIRRVIKL